MNHQASLDAPGADLGEEIHALAAELYPICRSITGAGVRRTLDIIGSRIELERHEVPTGTVVFDWTVPREWVIRDAWIRDASGRKVVDFHASNLHVLNYSAGIRARMPLAELKKHVFTLPEQPDLIPYRTSYYSERWGFCMAHRELEALPDGIYEVMIDAEHRDGGLSYAEHLHRGATDREVLLYAHSCHPSLANDNCSGLALLTALARRIEARATRYSYRFIFAPGTIGSLTWLSLNEARLAKIEHGLVVSCVGDGGGPTYKKSRRGDAFIDRAMAVVLKHCGREPVIKDFSPYGYDERQFCSPGFNLPVGLFQRSAFGTFPEYHTSADNLDFIRPRHLAESCRMIEAVIAVIEDNWTPLNLSPKGEPQLGRRGLYAAVGGDRSTGLDAMALLWVLNLADGGNDLLAIAERSGLSFAEVAAAARLLKDHGLLADVSTARS